MTKIKPPEEIAPENAGENTPDGDKKRYSVVISGRDIDGILYEQQIETPFEVETLTAENLAELQEQAEYIPGGFAGAMRIMEKRTREQKPTKDTLQLEMFIEDIAPYFECGMLAYMLMSANRHKELDFIMERFGTDGETVFSLYGKRPAFIQKELKKKYYKGRTFEEIEDEYINMFLALPFEEQQKGIDGKDVYLFPGTMYEHFINAWKEFILKKGEVFPFKLREPSEVYIPLDKTTSKVFNHKNPEEAEEIAGSVNIESKEERESGREIEISYVIKSEDKELLLTCSKKDLMFILFVDGIFTQARSDGVPENEVILSPYELAKIVYRAERPGTAYIDDIKERTRRLRRTSVIVNNAQMASARGTDKMEQEFYLLPCEINKEGNIHILKRPVIVEEWITQIMGEYVTKNPEVLCVPSVSMTDDNCAIILELLRSILGNFTPKDAQTGEKVFSYARLFDECGIPGKTDYDMVKRSRLKKIVEKCLVYWSGGLDRESKPKKKYSTFKKMPEATRIIDDFRTDKNNIYITPKPKNISGKNK